MTEVTDDEVVALVGQHSPALAAVVLRLLGEKDAALVELRDRMREVASVWSVSVRDAGGEFDQALSWCAGILREKLDEDTAAERGPGWHCPDPVSAIMKTVPRQPLLLTSGPDYERRYKQIWEILYGDDSVPDRRADLDPAASEAGQQ